MHNEKQTTLLGYVLGLVPLLGLVGLLVWWFSGGSRTASAGWMPELGIDFSFKLDALSMMFGVLVMGIGTLVLVYAGHYMSHDSHPVRFLVSLLAFLLAMLGLVLADDLVTIFLFWELTSITSFLLIGQTRTEQAKHGAIQAMLVTGLGGVCLLAAIVLIYSIAGTTNLSQLTGMTAVIKGSPWYGIIFGLTVVGCLAKSAQFPFHFWLPDSMAAPTPASAFLHSATMVKAGIYLLLRVEPFLGNTPAWHYTLMISGGMTMLLGAWHGLRQTDLKALLAYSTLSQLGALTHLLGVGTEKARAAVVVGIVAHAAYKSALFLGVGIIDHAAGTREFWRLGGLRKQMPLTAVLMALAAVSMAGLPPTAGFVGKELLLGSQGGSAVVAIGVVVGALLLAQAARLWFGVFGGLRSPGEPMTLTSFLQPHDPHPAMWVAVAVPAIAGLVLPWITPLSHFLSAAAGAEVELFPFHGLTRELAFSVGAMVIGAGLYFAVKPIISFQLKTAFLTLTRFVYDQLLRFMDFLAYASTRVQTGDIRFYLVVMLIAIGGTILYFSPLPTPDRVPMLLSGSQGKLVTSALAILRGFTLILAVASSFVSIVLRRDLFAILALGASGVAMVILFALEPAPDVALVMVVVDILTVVILVLALTKIPPGKRREAFDADKTDRRKWLHMAVSAGAGLFIALLSLVMLDSRPRHTGVTRYYEHNAERLTGAEDIVGSIVVDFRGFDTLIEITVFSLAGLGVYALLRYASRYAGDTPEPVSWLEDPLPRNLLGVAGLNTSPFLRAMAYLLLPLCLMISAVHMMYGHHQPGDGFTAGVIASLGVSFYFIVMGPQQTRRALVWLTPTACIGSGLLLVIVAQIFSGIGAGTGVFFSPHNFGEALHITRILPPKFAFSNSFCFEMGIFLTVLGSATFMIDTLSHPAETTENADDHFSIEEREPVVIEREESLTIIPEIISSSEDTK